MARAFSLTELVVATAIATILLASIASVITLAAKVLPRDDQSADALSVANLGLQRLTEDLRQARTVSSITATAITFTVADRGADGTDDTITYAWSGTAGAPLLRTFNAGAAETVVNDVRSLAFTADAFSTSRTSAAAGVEGAEQLLEEYNPASTGSGGGTKVASLSYPGLYLRPVLPADATAWRPTRLLFKADKESGGRATIMLVRKADASRRPMASNLWTLTVTSSTADNQTWRTASLSSLSPLNASEGLCILLTSTALQGSTSVYPDSGVLSAYDGYLLSTNSSLSWTFTKDTAFPFQLYGCVTRPTTSTSSFNRSDRIEIRLRANSAAAAELRTSVALPSRPGVS